MGKKPPQSHPLRQCLGQAVTLSSDFSLHHRQIRQLSVLASLLKNNQEGEGRTR